MSIVAKDTGGLMFTAKNKGTCIDGSHNRISEYMRYIIRARRHPRSTKKRIKKRSTTIDLYARPCDSMSSMRIFSLLSSDVVHILPLITANGQAYAESGREAREPSTSTLWNICPPPTQPAEKTRKYNYTIFILTAFFSFHTIRVKISSPLCVRA